MIFFQCFTELEPSVPFVPFVNSLLWEKFGRLRGEGLTINSVKSCYKQNAKFWVPEPSLLASLLEYIRKHAVRLLRLREQHTPPRSVVVIVISLQLMHFLIHISWWKVSHYLSLSLLLLLGPETKKYTVSIELN